MDMDTLRKRYKEEIFFIANLCNAENIRIFGSVATNTAKEGSDIDFLVHMKSGSGFCLGGLKWRLEELLQCRVDVVPDTSLHSLIKEKILLEAISL
ncbi:MAG: nucleotidyltransferase domain-containing protein [Chlamydiota bacterium]